VACFKQLTNLAQKGSGLVTLYVTNATRYYPYQSLMSPRAIKRRSETETMIKKMQTMPPVHPGELLRETLDELGITAYALAKSIGKAPIQISRILAGKSSISAPMACLIGASLGTTAQYWVNLQAHYDLEIAKQISPSLEVTPLVVDGKRVDLKTVDSVAGQELSSHVG